MQAEIIDFAKYKNEKENNKKIALKIKEIRKLKNKQEFDITFLELVDIFMQREYPDYYWRFEHFLNEIENANKRNN